MTTLMIVIGASCANSTTPSIQSITVLVLSPESSVCASNLRKIDMCSGTNLPSFHPDKIRAFVLVHPLLCVYTYGTSAEIEKAKEKENGK